MERKNLITGVAFALVAATASAASMSGTAQSLGRMGGQARSFMAYVGLSGVWSRKTLKIRSEMKVDYKAGYLYAPDGTNVLAGDWGTDQPGNDYADGGNSRVLGVHHTGVASLNGVVPATANAGFFAGNGALPRFWHVSTSTNNRNYGDHADDVKEATVENMTWALFAPGAAAALPDDKAWIQPENYTVKGGNVTDLEYTNWGLRLELGLGYRVMDGLALFLTLGHKFEFDHKDGKNAKDGLFFETQGTDKKFRAADKATDVTAKLDLASFAHNKNQIASKIKVTAKVKESFGVTGGVDWRPSPMFSLSLRTGVRRYDVEVVYKNGDYAYPGTTAYFTETYTQNSGRNRLLISQENESRKMTAVEWPVVFGAAARLVIMGVHCIGIGVDYTSFESKLSVAKESGANKTDEKNDSDKQTPSELRLANPYENAATGANIKTGTGVHQFVPQGNVTNTLTTTVEVQDLSISASYVLTL